VKLILGLKHLATSPDSATIMLAVFTTIVWISGSRMVLHCSLNPAASSSGLEIDSTDEKQRFSNSES
jgi:hypothetical protein